MRQIVNKTRLFAVVIAFLATAVSSYAQKPGTATVNENMLKYRYLDKDLRQIRFSGPRTFAERTYIFGGTSIEGLYQLGNHPESPGYAIGTRAGMGYWRSPLHGVEASLSYSMMPYGYWTENFLGSPVIANTIIKTVGLEANYVFNITNHTHRHDHINRLDFFYTLGANVGVGSKFSYGINSSIRAIYNLGSVAGVYLEPKVNLMDLKYVRPSISAGFTFRIKSSDYGLEPDIDTEKKDVLFALKSNALYWMVGAPNFSIESPINNRWSVCGDYVAPWNSSFATGLYYQLMMVNAEGRYWFGNRDKKPVMTGFFAGASVGGGYYDFMFGNTKSGIQGEFYILAGLSAGYSHSISRNDKVRLEYALGLGYLQTRYRKYHYDDFDYVLDAPREQIWQTTIIGPTQAKVSVVWLLHKNIKEVRDE